MKENLYSVITGIYTPHQKAQVIPAQLAGADLSMKVILRQKSSRNRVSQRCPGSIQRKGIISKWVPASAGMTCFDYVCTLMDPCLLTILICNSLAGWSPFRKEINSANAWSNLQECVQSFRWINIFGC